jgi:hypothetical protein
MVIKTFKSKIITASPRVKRKNGELQEKGGEVNSASCKPKTPEVFSRGFSNILIFSILPNPGKQVH